MDGAFSRDLSQVVHPGLPAPGGGFTFTPSGAEFSCIRLVTFQLTTSATVATRQVALQLNHVGNLVMADIPAPAGQTAGQTDTYTFGVGLYPFSVTAASAAVAPLPKIWMRLGQSLTVIVANIDTTDAIRRITVVLDQVEWLSDQDM